jgi:hypothetical protein
MGRKIILLASGLRQAGDFEEMWDGTDSGVNPLTGGVFNCALQADRGGM